MNPANEFFERVKRREVEKPPGKVKFIDSLGPCCHCAKRPAVTLVMLAKKAPIAGRGWGNPTCPCRLPPDGALAVLCELCHAKFEKSEFKPRYACRGFPATDGRIPYGQLRGRHAHKRTLHESIA